MRIRNAALVVIVAAPVVVAGVVGLAFASTHTVESTTAIADGPPVVDERDQYELVQEIIDARGKYDGELVAALDAVRASWQGRRYRWDVALVPPLCRSSHNCVAMPFDHLRHSELMIVQGWLPRIELSDTDHAALLRDCESHAQCVFTFEGRLDRFVLDVENPTSISFSDVEITGVRAAEAGESWIRRPRRASAHSGNPNVDGPRTPVRAEQG